MELLKSLDNSVLLRTGKWSIIPVNYALYKTLGSLGEVEASTKQEAELLATEKGIGRDLEVWAIEIVLVTNAPG